MSLRDQSVENIPQCLRDRPQWICWRYIPKASGKPGKRPVQATSGRNASTTDRSTWTSFEVAFEEYRQNEVLAGVAYVFAADDPYAGIDVDDCLDANGDFVWGREIVEQFSTYTEVSPSGRGVKLVLEGKKPTWAECIASGKGPEGKGQIEIYDRSRCFTITGHRLALSPEGIFPRQAELDALCAELWPHKANPASRPVAADDDLHKRMSACFHAIVAMRLTDRGDGSHRLYSACCRCVEYNLPDDAALRVLAKYAKHQPFPTAWSRSDVLKRLRSAEMKAERGAAVEVASRIQPSMRSVAQLLQNHPELRPPVIQGLLRTGETMNVIAPPKYGKSWLVTDLAMAVATGRRWLDAFDTVPGNVLVLDNELHSETSANRIPKVADARGIDLTEIADKLFVDNLRGRLMDVYSLQPYFESIAQGFFKIIVMDAFYRFLPKDSDENSNANMTDVYNRLDWYAAMLGCSFVLVHHASKGNQSGKAVTDVGAGAGSQARATDTHLIMRQHQEDGCVVIDAAVRSWQPLNPLCLRWSFPVWNIDDSLDPADLRPDRPRRKPKEKDSQPSEEAKWTPGRFAEAFVSGEPATIKSIIAAARDAGFTLQAAKDHIQIAEDSGLIHRWTFGANRPVKFANVPKPELSLSES